MKIIYFVVQLKQRHNLCGYSWWCARPCSSKHFNEYKIISINILSWDAFNFIPRTLIGSVAVKKTYHIWQHYGETNKYTLQTITLVYTIQQYIIHGIKKRQ
uniref:Uncharacterized protein n=1 Tax=Cacopsylla melanoneura TaxID=428564 RepID=A0A8D8RD69_9HEMI